MTQKDVIIVAGVIGLGMLTGAGGLIFMLNRGGRASPHGPRGWSDRAADIAERNMRSTSFISPEAPPAIRWHSSQGPDAMRASSVTTGGSTWYVTFDEFNNAGFEGRNGIGLAPGGAADSVRSSMHTGPHNHQRDAEDLTGTTRRARNAPAEARFTRSSTAEDTAGRMSRGRAVQSTPKGQHPEGASRVRKGASEDMWEVDWSEDLGLLFL